MTDGPPRPAAPTPAAGPARSARLGARRGSLATAAVALAAGMLFATNAQIFAGNEDRHPQNLEGLARTESDRLVELERENAALRAEIQPFLDTEQGGRAAGAAAGLVAEAAGQSAAQGPGLEVQLWDAPQQAEGLAATLPPDSLVVHQQDLEAVMNALWAGGAEAMTVQGHRVVSTTGVRCVGNVLYVAGRIYSPPYVVEAIGDPEELRGALLSAPGVKTYLQYVDAVRLGWSVRESEIEVPPYAGSLSLEHAQVLTDGAAGSGRAA